MKEYGWPKNMKFAVGVIDVKSPFIETPEAVSQKLHNVSDIDDIGEERVLGGTDCGFCDIFRYGRCAEEYCSS